MRLDEMVGWVVLARQNGAEHGTLEIKVVNGKPHAYVNLDNGKRVHVPFSPVVEREISEGWVQLGVKVDHSWGDAIKTAWTIRAV